MIILESQTAGSLRLHGMVYVPDIIGDDKAEIHVRRGLGPKSRIRVFSHCFVCTPLGC